MNNYQKLLDKCPEIGDSVDQAHFADATTLAREMNISNNKFAEKFSHLPKVSYDELENNRQEITGVFAKSYGSLFVNLNQTARKAFNDYLKAKIF